MLLAFFSSLFGGSAVSPIVSPYRVSADQLIYAFDQANLPVLRVPNHATVVFSTCDCFENQIQSTEAAFTELDWSRINPATGPVFVEGAAVGDVLKVVINDIQVGAQAVMVTAPKLGAIGEQIQAPTIHTIPIIDGVATLMGGVKLPIQPMIGVIGTAPAGAAIPCGTPDAHGGNMDCNVITAGATLYLPVNVEGALLAMGDLHAAMGDGEVSGCGLEIAGEVSVTISVIKNSTLPTPFVVRQEGLYAIASSLKLDDAANLASANMANWLTQNTPLSLSEAISLMSVAGDLQICQVVDPLKTCRFFLPDAICQQLNLNTLKDF